MNYRHAFHAGNFADVLKHVILVELLQALKAKPAPFCYIDTHAARGRYDLAGEAAQRTGEHRDGVLRLLDAPALPAALQAYVELVRTLDGASGDTLASYPGSPLIAARLMREQDRAIVCELHEEEAAALKRELQRDARFAVHRRNGYEALKALLPPAQKRGLVLIDPPFEAQAGEFTLIEAALHDAFARWPNAIYAVWYPIKLRETIMPFHRWLAAHAGAADVLVAELLLHPDNSPLRLNGCGMAIVNPPWRYDQSLADWLPKLGGLLAPAGGSHWRIDWLKTG